MYCHMQVCLPAYFVLDLRSLMSIGTSAPEISTCTYHTQWTRHAYTSPLLHTCMYTGLKVVPVTLPGWIVLATAEVPHWLVPLEMLWIVSRYWRWASSGPTSVCTGRNYLSSQAYLLRHVSTPQPTEEIPLEQLCLWSMTETHFAPCFGQIHC